MANGLKTGGRKAGTPNKKTLTLRQSVDELIRHNWHTLQADIEQLEPKDRLAFLEKLLAYSLPKAVRSDPSKRLDELDENQLNALIDLILNAKNR